MTQHLHRLFLCVPDGLRAQANALAGAYFPGGGRAGLAGDVFFNTGANIPWSNHPATPTGQTTSQAERSEEGR